MIVFAKSNSGSIYAIHSQNPISSEDKEKLNWLLDGKVLDNNTLEGFFKGPRKEMLTPWATNAVEITQNMGIQGILRIEEFSEVDNANAAHDSMLEVIYNGLGQDIFEINIKPEPIKYIDDIDTFNKEEGLALSDEEINYLKSVAEKNGRKLTDSEVFGFSQVNSEHCRHKIFNGRFIIDGEEKPLSLFKLIKKTTETNPNKVVSAYKDNVSFTKGPKIEQFAPATQDKADFFEIKEVDSVLSLKAETHNFPTTVEPFNGAATGSGGEIRDRIAGGIGSAPLAGTAVYMTAYSRLEEGRTWENGMAERNWLYQTPMDILIKASNGASDFGNKFGQPVINGSVFTFEHQENGKRYGFDKVIMQAGGVGYGLYKDAKKNDPKAGDKIVVMGGDNYRIGMGGSAVSSLDTGASNSAIELNAIQRSNPEMQKRVFNAIRAMMESGHNPIVSIHDHGAGGHLNCLSELVEATGGKIDLAKLPVGDPTLSAKEICGNESQERMGLVIQEKDIDTLQKVAERERAPFYVVGDITGDHQFTFESSVTGEKPIDWKLEDMFGNPPKTIMNDEKQNDSFSDIEYKEEKLADYLNDVLQLEAVACKDWLTNKVDRSVTGRVAQQQNVGSLQLPLSNFGAMAMDYRGKAGVATAVGHAPAIALANPAAGSRIAIAESLANIVFAPIESGLAGISLSANWMWPCKNKGEDARLYEAVEAVSDFACELGINIPTGKDSLSMTQKYKDGVVYSPGTVIISASGEVTDVKKHVTPNLVKEEGTELIYIDLTKSPLALGGSSFAQVLNKVGNNTPDIKDVAYFKAAFNAVQDLIENDLVLAGHDVSSGGLITTLLEMCFAEKNIAINANVDFFKESSLVKVLFAENPALVLQVKNAEEVKNALAAKGVQAEKIGTVVKGNELTVNLNGNSKSFNVDDLRTTWYKTSYLLDAKQTKPELAKERFENYTNHELQFNYPAHFTGKMVDLGLEHGRKTKSGIKAAIIREKGVNGDREMAYSMFLAGFDVKDVHMTDLIAGREDLSDVNFIVYVGGFSNSDVLGSAKGWAGAFLYNEKAKAALDNFYARPDTLSLGVCNGCQLMVELGLIYPEHQERVKMKHNSSGKFESIFLNVNIAKNTNSILLKSLAGSKLGIWVAHGEGKFEFPYECSEYNIAIGYSHGTYPANPNGSRDNTAAIVSKDGRHLAMMPHLERAIFPWQTGFYPNERKSDEVTPWIEAFVNARKWIEENKK
ncbi:phosphoribosylformylglycinamidine synthase [Pseudopedobacter saltans DSM 12145]|uniref:Phosphoribosylformylglycinamidine synthase n=1 Tax=Pseudopedobacter saltans (strain ATCC 51119 / DSM 12145 / JCM 21818 / CCUG 39354 / LMG 10337 / NBRC 100064 / NCIMB 13643) TaxID=762903 RepID=F0SDX6_PSESL|nr:phosphoribosylformylglycinamidine synthase [Pseudopedobacter saltans]ADY51872.1 phosphoribosylformylglycinamidine synthase [Pseudopedobacter saltans DSM 12145]